MFKYLKNQQIRFITRDGSVQSGSIKTMMLMNGIPNYFVHYNSGKHKRTVLVPEEKITEDK